jgi:hypothetical protein
MEELAPADPANTADAPTKKRGGARNALNEAIGECGEEDAKMFPERNDKGQFVLGHNGGPGRPKGSRNQLGEALLADLYADWLQHGAEVIRQVRESRPADYLKIVAMIVSKCEDLSLDGEMRDAAVEQFIEERRQKALVMIAKMDEAE